MLSSRTTIAAIFCGIVGLSCGDTGTAPTTLRMEFAKDGSPPPIGEGPFPSDLWMGAEGKLSLAPDLEALFGPDAENMQAHLALLDGFGTRSAVDLPMTGPLDPDSIPASTETADQPIFVINVDEDSPHRGEVAAYQWRYDTERMRIEGAPRPGTVLESDTTYAAVLTKDVLDSDGKAIALSPALATLRDSKTLPANLQSTARGLESVESFGGFEKRIAGLTVFTVQNASGSLLAARAALEDEARTPPPSMVFADPSTVFAGTEALDQLLGVAARAEDGPRVGEERWGHSNPTGIAHDHVGVVATGELTLARFRRPSTGDRSTEDGTFELDEEGLPRLQAMDTIPITVVLPAAPPPDAGYPVVLFGHGLGSSRHAILTFAEPLTRQGMAVFAIDFDGHGSRFNPRDESNNTGAMLSDFQGDPALSDGFGDITGLMSTFEFLGGARNFSRARDGILQSVLDISSLSLALRHGDYDLSLLASDSAGAPRLDASHISYLGESFGTLVGGVLAAVEPEIQLYVLDVAAAGIVDLAILNSPALASLLMPLAYFNFGWRDLPDRFASRVALLQAMVDAADPLSFAPHVLRDRFHMAGKQLSERHVVVLEVLGDEAIHNLATDSLACAMGLELLIPNDHVPDGLATVDSPALGNVDGQTGVIVQYGPAEHGANWSSETGKQVFVPGFPHEGDDPFPKLEEARRFQNPLYETLEQVTEILLAHQSGETPPVRSTEVPHP